MDQKQRETNAAFLDWFDALIFALTIVLVLLLFVARTVNIKGESMLPTLESGDQILARSFLYKPKRGDIVVIDEYTQFGVPLVKRIIGVGGDTIDLDAHSGDIYVNSQKIDEPYLAPGITRESNVSFPLTVPEGKLFLMGDNRESSQDSRDQDIGFIDERDVLGQGFFRLLPFQNAGLIQ